MIDFENELITCPATPPPPSVSFTPYFTERKSVETVMVNYGRAPLFMVGREDGGGLEGAGGETRGLKSQRNARKSKHVGFRVRKRREMFRLGLN